ncbi:MULTISPECIES: hypothetical protein [unclassified Streptomyces]|uniref:hypothetical protein n=1 Tax=unclassified Streptomyces TaxID=2593676 RepID=UPI00344E55E7
MPTAPGTAPTPRHPPADLAPGFLAGGVTGASLTALVGGFVVGVTPLVVTGLVLLALFGLFFLLVTRPRAAREAADVPRTSLAAIEEFEAAEGEASDVPVRFVLSVAPDDAPPFRVEMRQDVHLSELPGYRPRGVVVVEHPSRRPWKTRIVRRPTPWWEERAAVARVDPAPGPVLRHEVPNGCLGSLLPFLGLLLGVAAVLLLFRADLFGPPGDEGTPGRSVSSLSTDLGPR